MIKVVHIGTSIKGGAGIAMLRLHESLMQEEKIESHILQTNPTTPLDESKNIHQCTHFHPLAYRIKKKIGLLSRLSRIEYYTKKIENQPKDYEMATLPFSYYPLHLHPLIVEADIINLHWTSKILDFPTFFENIKQPIVWTLHDEYPFLGLFHYLGDSERNTNKTLKEIDNRVKEIKLRSYAKKKNLHIVYLSEWMKEQSTICDLFSKLESQIIPNGLNYNRYPILDREYAKKILGIDNSKKNILFVAENIRVYRKGMDMLLAALNQINTESFNLISVGSGDIHRLLDPSISYTNLGSIQNPNLLNLIYSASDITIIPSREDNLPNVMTESMLNGTPVVSFNNGGMREHIITGRNGILVTDMDCNALAHAIKDFIDGRYQFDHNIIRQYPIENLNYQKQTDAYIDLYNSILNK